MIFINNQITNVIRNIIAIPATITTDMINTNDMIAIKISSNKQSVENIQPTKQVRIAIIIINVKHPFIISYLNITK